MAKAKAKEKTVAPRYGMVIHADRCTGCYNCFLACRDEFSGNDYLPFSVAQPDGQSWIKVRELERGSFPKTKVSYVPVPCLNCVDAPCISAATDGAAYRRPDGIVIFDPEKAAGQRDIASACPYGVIFWNEQKDIPQKCTFCAHLLDDGWKEPRCVEACPTQALTFGNLDDPDSEVARMAAQQQVEELAPRRTQRPPVVFLGLPSSFIVGEVVLGDKIEDSPRGVRITLRGAEQTLAASTDNYGDFEFSRLRENSEYLLTIEHAGYKPYKQSVRTDADPNIGTIVLESVAG